MWGRLGMTMTVAILGLTANLVKAQEAPSCNLQANPDLVVSLDRNYSPGEFREILHGFGYNVTFGDIIYDQASKKAIRDFQQGYNIPVDGTANSQTQELAADLATTLQANLNLVIKPNPPLPQNQFYGLRTEAAIRNFQKQYNFPETGIATLPVRIKLDQEAKKVLCTVYPQLNPQQYLQPMPGENNQERTDGKG